MTTLFECFDNLVPEEVPTEVNVNAPPPGARPPAIKPTANVPFRFFLAKKEDLKGENRDVVEGIRDGRHLQINFTAVINVPKADGGTYEKEVKFQKVDTFKGDWMDNCSAFDLIRSMGLVAEYQENLEALGDVRKALAQTLVAADGRGAGVANFGWTARFTDAQLTYSTAQGKRYVNKKGWITDKWPRNADGTLCETVSDPTTGEEKFGNLEITGFRIGKPVQQTVTA